MIRIGPAGIPLSCKGRTLKDGIIYTKSLELDALEVQFVRGIRMTEEDAAEVGEVAEAAEVELHVHAPYYTNLAGDERNLQLSREKILKAANLAHIMGADTVAVHPGFYGDLSPEEALERVVQVAGDLRDEFKANKWKPKLALEMMGKRAVFGSLEEIIEVCKQVEGVLPVVDFAHIHARGNGSLNTVEDFQEVFDKLIPLGLDHYLVHFTGVLYENGNERHHLPIKKGDLRFEPLVEVILENDYNVTLISTSPILEHDAMYMQIVLDRVKEKREQRLQKDAARAQQEAEKAEQDAEKAREEEEARRAMEAAEAAKRAAEEKARQEAEPRPVCAAVTHAGDPCKNPARASSKYCSSHKGWRPSKEQREAMEELEAKKAQKSAKRAADKAAAASGARKATKKAPAKKAADEAAPTSGASRKASDARKAAKKSEPAKSAGGANQAAKKSASTKKQPARKSRKEVAPKKGADQKPAKKTPKKSAANKSTGSPGKAAKKTAKKAAAKKSTPKKKPTAKKAAAGAKKSSSAAKTPAKKAATGTSRKSQQKTKSSPADKSEPTAPSATKEKKGGRLKAAADKLLGRRKK